MHELRQHERLQLRPRGKSSHIYTTTTHTPEARRVAGLLHCRDFGWALLVGYLQAVSELMDVGGLGIANDKEAQVAGTPGFSSKGIAVADGAGEREGALHLRGLLED